MSIKTLPSFGFFSFIFMWELFSLGRTNEWKHSWKEITRGVLYPCLYMGLRKRKEKDILYCGKLVDVLQIGLSGLEAKIQIEPRVRFVVYTN